MAGNELPYQDRIAEAYRCLFRERPNPQFGLGGILWLIFQSDRIGELPAAVLTDLAELVLEGPEIPYTPSQRALVLREAERILGRPHPSASG